MVGRAAEKESSSSQFLADVPLKSLTASKCASISCSVMCRFNHNNISSELLLSVRGLLSCCGVAGVVVVVAAAVTTSL